MLVYMISIYSSSSVSQASEIFRFLVFLMKKLRPWDIRYKPGWGQAFSLSQELPPPSHSPNIWEEVTLVKKAAQTKELCKIFKLFRINDIFSFLNYVHSYEEDFAEHT